MGVYIKGMEMPKSCHECRLYNDPWCMAKNRNQWRTAYNRPPKGERQNDCPLVPAPPHGRLGDLDALMQIIREHDYPLKAHFNSTDNGMFTIGIQQAVDEAPPIIEADPTEEIET